MRSFLRVPAPIRLVGWGAGTPPGNGAVPANLREESVRDDDAVDRRDRISDIACHNGKKRLGVTEADHLAR